jgi:hypothetical protein
MPPTPRCSQSLLRPTVAKALLRRRKRRPRPLLSRAPAAAVRPENNKRLPPHPPCTHTYIHTHTSTRTHRQTHTGTHATPSPPLCAPDPVVEPFRARSATTQLSRSCQRSAALRSSNPKVKSDTSVYLGNVSRMVYCGCRARSGAGHEGARGVGACAAFGWWPRLALASPRCACTHAGGRSMVGVGL